jgi:hypothetical protein
MEVRPYTVLADSTLAVIEGKFDAALAAWCADWGINRDTLVMECKRAWETAGLPHDVAWQRYGPTDTFGTMWLSGQAKVTDALQSCMFPSDGRHAVSRLARPTSLAREAASSAMEELIGKIVATLGGTDVAAQGTESESPEDILTQYASGALAASIRIGQAAFTVLLDATCVRRNMPPRAFSGSGGLQAVRRGSLLGNVPLSLSLELGKAQVDAGSLMSLAPGDVIRVQSVIDQPLPVFNSEGQVMFAGYLAASGESVVLEVVRNG